MNANELKGKCQFYLRAGNMYGRCCLQLRDGRKVVVESRRGIPVAMLTHTIAQKEAEVSGFFSDAWKKARKVAKTVAKKTISTDILKQAKAIATSDLGSAALSFVPGGAQAMKAVELGTKAAGLLSEAQAGVKEAKQRIKKIVALADEGHEEAAKALNILKAVHQKGKKKGVFPSKKKPKKLLPSSPAPAVQTLKSATRAAAPSVTSQLSTYRMGIRGGVSVGHWSQWMYA